MDETPTLGQRQVGWGRAQELEITETVPPVVDERSGPAAGYAPIVGVLLLGLVLRAWGVGDQSLTMDELADIQSARRAVGEIIHTRDGLPPLYGLLLHGWLSTFASNEAARWLSVLIGLLAIPALWRLAAHVGGERVGLWAALALALSPLHIWFSQEARVYVLYVLLAVVALWRFFVAMSTNRHADWLLYALVCAAGLYTHYYFLLLPLTAGLLLLSEKRRLRELTPGLLANVAFGLAALSILGLLREDLSYQADYPHVAPFNIVTLGYTYFSLVTGFTLGPSLRELHVLPAAIAVRLVLPWVVIVASVLLVLGYYAFRTLGSRATVMRLVVLVTVPVFVGGILAIAVGIGFRVRYVAWVAVPLYVLLGAGLASTRLRWPRTLATVALFAVWAVALVSRRSVERHWNEDARALGRFLRSTSNPSVPVFVMSDYMAVPVEYYLGVGWNVCALPNVAAGATDASGPLRVIRTLTPVDSAFWLVYTRPFHSDPEGHVPRDLLASRLIRPRAEFAGVTLYEGRVRSTDRAVAPLGCKDLKLTGDGRAVARTD